MCARTSGTVENHPVAATCTDEPMNSSQVSAVTGVAPADGANATTTINGQIVAMIVPITQLARIPLADPGVTRLAGSATAAAAGRSFARWAVGDEDHQQD